jgi:paraquat-inducible protein B
LDGSLSLTVKTKTRPAVIGAFVIGAMTLALVALFSFGGINIFDKPERFVVYFNESVHGLDLGSPVKLRGVRIGRVVDLSIRYSAERRASVVAVVCELSRNTLTDDQGRMIDVSDRAELQRLVDRGLRAQLGLLGLATGMLYVELDFADPEDAPAPPPTPAPRPQDARYAVVPAAPSAISEFQASLSDILNKVRQIDFAGISRELQGLLTDARRQINGFDGAALSREWTKTARSVDALATSPAIPKAFDELASAATALKAMSQRLDGQVEPTAAELAATLAQARTTLASFNEAAVAARQFVQSQSGLGEEAARALTQLGEAAAAVERLADYLERNPSAVVSGRARTP